MRLGRTDEETTQIRSDLIEYCEALGTVVRHRRFTHQLTLVNHVRLHQIVMRVLGRLVDFAGLWERDLYFTTLALLHLRPMTPEEVFKSSGLRSLRNGQIVQALENVRADQRAWLHDALSRRFGAAFLGKAADAPKQIRNRLAHLNMLGDAVKATGAPDRSDARRLSLNLTREIARTRELMAYDRKLKNAVTKAVIGALEREKIALSWRFKCHLPGAARVRAGRAEHLKCRELAEDLHDPGFLRMVAAVFNGKVASGDAASIENRPPDQVVGSIFARLERTAERRNKQGSGQAKW